MKGHDRPRRDASHRPPRRCLPRRDSAAGPRCRRSRRCGPAGSSGRGIDRVPRQRDDGANIGRLFSKMLIKRCSFAGSAEDEDGHAASYRLNWKSCRGRRSRARALARPGRPRRGWARRPVGRGAGRARRGRDRLRRRAPSRADRLGSGRGAGLAAALPRRAAGDPDRARPQGLRARDRRSVPLRHRRRADRRRSPLRRCEIIPQLSSFSLACARLRWPQEECALVSLHGRALQRIIPHLQPDARVLALSWDASTPAAVAALLTARGLRRQPARRAGVARRAA